MIFLWAFLTALAITIAVTPIVMRLAVRLRLVDDKKYRRHPAQTHEGIIPRAGGSAVFLGIAVTILLFIPVNKIIAGILIGSILITLLGLADDYYDISPYKRFFLNIAIATITVFFGLGVPYISNPFGGVIRLDTVILSFNFFGHHSFLLFANIFAIIWIVALMNFVNWSKGVDGQMPGFVAVAAFILGIVAYRFTGHEISAAAVSLLAFAVSGAFLGFLYFNIFPQKIMPGYGGGALAGYMLAVLSILSWAKLGTLILVLSIPLVDAMYVMVRRLKDLKSPFKGDAGHFHHRLLAIGWSKKRIAYFYWFVSLLFGVSSLYLRGIEKLFALLLISTSLAFFIIIINRIKNLQNNS